MKYGVVIFLLHELVYNQQYSNLKNLKQTFCTGVLVIGFCCPIKQQQSIDFWNKDWMILIETLCTLFIYDFLCEWKFSG